MMSPAKARVWWYAPFLLAAAVQGYSAIVELLAGELVHALTFAIFAALLALWPVRGRAEFRQGWRSGFLEGLYVPVEIDRGGIPDAVVRHAATGTPAPDPWEPRPILEIGDTSDDTKE